jgi:2-polyprenyl-3-methyl-5-hydroxy-6-metoxy-1,4-benzoquinol methylase
VQNRNMRDYLEVEYNQHAKPITTYPAKLARYIYAICDMRPGQSILEVGSGRCEILSEFKKLGLITYAVDSAESAKEYAEHAGAYFEIGEVSNTSGLEFFKNTSFDFIYSKSFVEHLHNPETFAENAFQRLKFGGKFVALTPDFESNYMIFYDDITHVKPFTQKTMSQMLELVGYKNLEVFRFRQLPSTWNSQTMNMCAFLSAKIAKPRSKNKWFRWSRELMIAGIGIKDE